MKIFRRFLNRLVGSFTGRLREAELAEEMEMHVRMQADDNIRKGMSPEERRAGQRN